MTGTLHSEQVLRVGPEEFLERNAFRATDLYLFESTILKYLTQWLSNITQSKGDMSHLFPVSPFELISYYAVSDTYIVSTLLLVPYFLSDSS